MMSTMKAVYLSLLFVCLFLSCIGQAPKLSVVVGGGVLRPFETIDDPYDGYVYHRHGASFGLGVAADFRSSRHVHLSLEGGYEIHQLNYGYSSRVVSSTVAKLWFGSIRIAPGMKIWLHQRVFIRAGINGLIAAGGLGEYVVDGKELMGINRIIYTNHFGKIRRFGNVGPEVAIGYGFQLNHDRDLFIRLGGFLGLVPPFAKLPYETMNPYMARINLEISYPLSRRN